MKTLISRRHIIIGSLSTLLPNICLLHCCELKVIGKPLNAPSTQAVYDSMVKDNTKKINPTLKKSSESHDEEFIQKAQSCIRQGNIDGATTFYYKALAINPTNFKAHLYLGNLLFNKGEIDKALESYKKAAEINAGSAVTQHNIGLCYKKKDEINDAIAHFQEAIRLRPDYTRAYLHLGLLLEKLGKKDQALEIFNKSLAINPKDALILRQLGCLYRDQNKFDKAIEAFYSAVELEPKSTTYIMELANTHTMADNNEQALELYQRALEIDPSLNSALNNIGYVLKRQGHVQQAIEVFNKVCERAPNDAQAHFSLGLCHLILGQFDLGLPEYEWRWQAYNESKPSIGDKPYFDGTSYEDKTIVIQCEQGLGDTFQFIRYAKLLHEKKAHIIIVAQKPLKTLLQTCCNYIDKVILPGESIPPYDYQIPLMSLPYVLNTRVNTIYNDIPYIKADQVLATYWKTKLNTKTFNVGLCWQGNAQYRTQLLQLAVSAKSTSLQNFLPLTNVQGCSFYSLQKVNGTDQLKQFTASIIDFGKEIDEEHGSFMDTAAIITNLDLVITIDTSIAHLASALGKPTWILLPNPADWRWMLDRTDSPWYPNVRLFRQKTPGDWQSSMKEVIQALKDYIPQNRQSQNMISQKQKLIESTLPKTTLPVVQETTRESRQPHKKSDEKQESQSIEEFIDKLTIEAIQADTSINIQELSLLMNNQVQDQKKYDHLVKNIPQLKDLTVCLLYCNKLLYNLEKKIHQQSIFSPEYDDLEAQRQWICTFKNNLKREIKKLEQAKQIKH